MKTLFLAILLFLAPSAFAATVCDGFPITFEDDGTITGPSCQPVAPPPDPDSDGDGIPDADDMCPNEFGTPPDGCPEPPPVGGIPPQNGPNTIAALGCSNTEQHVIGYRRRSSLDTISEATYPLGGLTFNDWANLNGPAWSRMSSGYDAVWLQLCMRNDEHNGQMTADHQSKILDIIGKLGSDYGIAPSQIWISGLNELENNCTLVAPDGDEVGRAIADWAAANAGTNRGLDTHTDFLAADNCHLSWQGGIQEIGQQMVDYFDQ